MEKIKIKDFTFTYPCKQYATLNQVNASVFSGEFVVLLGTSGSGKTTLLKNLKKELAPNGEKEGEILINAEFVGFVGQNPRAQIVCDKVWHELAFGLENMGKSKTEIRAKVAEIAAFFGIEKWFHKNTQELSGGQMQILNLASVMAMDPDVLVLDEPLSQLDPIASTDFLNMLVRINKELGTTVILSEHRTEETLHLADKVWIMKDRQLTECAPCDIGKNLTYRYLPTPTKIFGDSLTVKDARQKLLNENIKNEVLLPEKHHKNEVSIELKDVCFRYTKDEKDILSGVNAQIKNCEIFGILGANASGKSSLLSVISGIKKATSGKVITKGKVTVLPQNQEILFMADTVLDDMYDVTDDEEKIKHYAKVLNIEHILTSHPHDISGGEQERAALMKVLLCDGDILLLDEPTKGMDADFKEEFAEILKKLKDTKTIIIVSHDMEFCARVCDRCALLFDGEFTSVDEPYEFFGKNTFYTTTANRIARGIIKNAILPENILAALERSVIQEEKAQPRTKEEPKKECTITPKKEKRPKKAIYTYLGMFLLIPLTLLLGVRFFGDRRYYFMSLLVIAEAIIAFALGFEQGKNKSRKLVMIAIFSAIAVAGREALFMIPAAKPVLAVITLAGVTLGAEAGFLTGAATAFVSNMFAGQGAWTPWQMFAMGMVGFVAALIFYKGKIKPHPITLAVYGLLSSVVIYGGIMNPASLVLWQPEPTWEMLVSTIALGFPYDLTLGVATSVFLLLISKIFIKAINRVRIKYGI